MKKFVSKQNYKLDIQTQLQISLEALKHTCYALYLEYLRL